MVEKVTLDQGSVEWSRPSRMVAVYTSIQPQTSQKQHRNPNPDQRQYHHRVERKRIDRIHPQPQYPLRNRHLAPRPHDRHTVPAAKVERRILRIVKRNHLQLPCPDLMERGRPNTVRTLERNRSRDSIKLEQIELAQQLLSDIVPRVVVIGQPDPVRHRLGPGPFGTAQCQRHRPHRILETIIKFSTAVSSAREVHGALPVSGKSPANHQDEMYVSCSIQAYSAPLYPSSSPRRLMCCTASCAAASSLSPSRRAAPSLELNSNSPSIVTSRARRSLPAGRVRSNTVLMMFRLCSFVCTLDFRLAALSLASSVSKSTSSSSTISTTGT
uniref:Uncharacterized protein n=1 Tax=Anopheles coluzzii TaxID=1518534 RepID=A0A8W7PK15_ANOCL